MSVETLTDPALNAQTTNAQPTHGRGPGAGFTAIAVDAVGPSATNPRRSFDEARLQELAESVRKHGVLQPILVRAKGRGKPQFEIVAGERRWRAAKIAGLAEIPAIVRAMDDLAVLEVQVVENLQRDDLTPIEEAEGYERLVKQHGYTAVAIAQKIGKSKEYVYARMKLTALCPAGRAALAQEHLTTEVALLLARVPTRDLQEQALSRVKGDDDHAPMPVKRVRELLHREFMLHLKDARFDLADASLWPPAGPCTTCPKRTSNARELFPDVGNADVCTDPPCFRRKRDAAGTRRLAAARAQGREVFDGKAAEKLFSEWGDHELQDDNLVDLGARCEALGWEHRKHWRATLGKKCPAPILALDPEGNVRELLRRDDALAALKERGLKVPAGRDTGTSGGSSYLKEQRERTKKQQRMAAIAQAAVTAALPKAASLALDPTAVKHEALWRLLARAAYESTGVDRHAFIAKRRGLARVQTEARAGLEKWLKGNPPPEECEAFVIECLVGARWNGDYWNATFGKEFKEFCALTKVDLEALQAQSSKAKAQKKCEARSEKAQ